MPEQLARHDSMPRQWVVHSSVVFYPPIVVTKEEAISIEEGTRIDAFVKLEGGERLDIGKWVHVASFSHINVGGGFVYIHDGATLSSGAKIIAGGHTPESETCSTTMPAEQQSVVPGIVTLGRNACLFANAIVVCKGGEKIRIGEGSRVGAGSVVLCDIPSFELWAGNPARFIRRLK